MGAGILPTTIHEGKLYFLFGKENKYADTPGWSDFGGGTDKKETFLQTAIREAGEELTGFLGSDQDVSKMLKVGTYDIDNERYRMHIFHYPYNPFLPKFYNNNQQFLQKHLDAKVIQDSKIFEKAEIRWISETELPKMRSEFRSYFQKVVDKILKEKENIRQFIEKGNIKKRENKMVLNKKQNSKKTRKNRTEKKEPKKKTEWWKI